MALMLFLFEYLLFRILLELEEVFRVVVADVFNHLIYALHLAVGNLAILYVAAHEVAQGTTEVLVTRIREE